MILCESEKTHIPLIDPFKQHFNLSPPATQKIKLLEMEMPCFIYLSFMSIYAIQLNYKCLFSNLKVGFVRTELTFF